MSYTINLGANKKWDDEHSEESVAFEEAAIAELRTLVDGLEGVNHATFVGTNLGTVDLLQPPAPIDDDDEPAPEGHGRVEKSSTGEVQPLGTEQEEAAKQTAAPPEDQPVGETVRTGDGSIPADEQPGPTGDEPVPAENTPPQE